jgi:hypothetical protein
MIATIDVNYSVDRWRLIFRVNMFNIQSQYIVSVPMGGSRWALDQFAGFDRKIVGRGAFRRSG